MCENKRLMESEIFIVDQGPKLYKLANLKITIDL